MKKVIGFDFGYTLVALNREGPLQHALRELGYSCTLEEVAIAFHLADKHFMRHFPGVLGQDPRTFYPWYLGVVCSYLHARTDLIALSRKVQDPEQKVVWSLYPWTKGVLQELAARNYRLFLLSNWDKSIRQLLKSWQLEQFFDEIIVSAEVGMEKPDPGIFRLALERLKVESDEVLYVGDNYYDDYAGASQLGIECLLINRFGLEGVEDIVDRIDRRNLTVLHDASEVISYLKAEEMKSAPELRRNG